LDQDKNDKKGDKSNSSSWMFAGYGSYQLDSNWFVRGSLMAGSNAMIVKEARISGIKGKVTATSKYNVESYGVEAALGYNYRIMNHDSILTPTLGLRATYLSDIDYTETGAGIYNKKVAQKSTATSAIIGGLQFATNTYANGIQIIPEGHVNMQYEFGQKSPKGHFKLESGTGVANYVGTKPSAFLTSLGTSVTAFSNNVEYRVGYDLNIADKYMGHQGTLKVKVKF
jgi:outer membrane autotransporter protein